MNKEAYINSIVKELKCSSAKKKDIKKQLESDINMKLEQGECLAAVIEEMGTVEEIVEGFNENLSEKDIRNYKRGLVLKILIPVVAVIAVLIGFKIWYDHFAAVKPVAYEYFYKEELGTKFKQTVTLFNESNYDALNDNSVAALKPVFINKNADTLKAQISEDWGELVSYSEMNIAEIVQFGKHYGFTQARVTYENTSVLFNITFDTDGKIAGFYCYP